MLIWYEGSQAPYLHNNLQKTIQQQVVFEVIDITKHELKVREKQELCRQQPSR